MKGMRKMETGEELSSGKMDRHTNRIEACLDRILPPVSKVPGRLHEAMRYSVLNGGKRVRPLLVYAAGECLNVGLEKLDMPATAIELLHAFSLVHDDLPAMDNDDLRRGQPTVHRKFDEATAILAADALQPLAFQAIATAPSLNANEITNLVALIADACGSLGMTGGQSIDLASEGKQLSVAELTELHSLKTGALIRASAMSACSLAPEVTSEQRAAMNRFAADIGLAFQIRDDILDVIGHTQVIGKPTGSDENLQKATWPSVFGMEESIQRCDELLQSSREALAIFGSAADSLQTLATFIVERER
jgi:geranylgeranyl pyrophosphate synthase